MFQGAFWGLMIGLAVGLVRFVLTIIYPGGTCGQAVYVPAVIGKVRSQIFDGLFYR